MSKIIGKEHTCPYGIEHLQILNKEIHFTQIIACYTSFLRQYNSASQSQKQGNLTYSSRNDTKIFHEA